jgi:hypothetical protein
MCILGNLPKLSKYDSIQIGAFLRFKFTRMGENETENYSLVTSTLLCTVVRSSECASMDVISTDAVVVSFVMVLRLTAKH